MELDGDQAGYRQCDVRGCEKILREEGDSPKYEIGDLMWEIPEDIQKETDYSEAVDLCEDHATLLATFVCDFFDGKRVLRPGRVEDVLDGLMLNAQERLATHKGIATAQQDGIGVMQVEAHAKGAMDILRRVGDKLGIEVKEVPID